MPPPPPPPPPARGASAVGLHKGGTDLWDTDDATDAADALKEMETNIGRDLEEQRRKGHANYMKFYRSLRGGDAPKEIVAKYKDDRGCGFLRTLRRSYVRLVG
jgi:hypothetical protein